MPQSYDFIFISARDFCQKLLKKFGTHILLGKNLRHLRYLRDNEQVTLIHIKLGMTCKVRTGKQNVPFLFLVTDNCSHFSSDELIKPGQRYKKYSIFHSYWTKKCWFYSIRRTKWIKSVLLNVEWWMSVECWVLNVEWRCVKSPRHTLFLFELKFRKFCPTRPERAEAPSPGHRPGLLRMQTCRPVRAKALKLQAKHKAFALTGRLADCHYTQGDALG